MRFWDSSATVPLLLDQPRTGHVRELIRADADMVVWWGTLVECASAIARLHRDGDLDAGDESAARALLAELSATWSEIQPGAGVRDLSLRLLRVHPLRAADALQLAAALEWTGPSARGRFVTFDDRLRAAAGREGLTLD